MALKFKLKTKDEIPAELVNLYVERDGAWLLDVDGAVEKAKLEEFRATNVALMKERDELKQRFEGIDPEEVRKLADEKRKLEEAQQPKAGEVEKVVETRLRAVKGDLDKKLAYPHQRQVSGRRAWEPGWPLGPAAWGRLLCHHGASGPESGFRGRKSDFNQSIIGLLT